MDDSRAAKLEPEVEYLDPKSVADVRLTKKPSYSDRHRLENAKKIPTRWMLVINKCQHRVYMTQDGDDGQAYVLVEKKRLFLGSFNPSKFRVV